MIDLDGERRKMGEAIRTGPEIPVLHVKVAVAYLKAADDVRRMAEATDWTRDMIAEGLEASALHLKEMPAKYFSHDRAAPEEVAAIRRAMILATRECAAGFRWMTKNRRTVEEIVETMVRWAWKAKNGTLPGAEKPYMDLKTRCRSIGWPAHRSPEAYEALAYCPICDGHSTHCFDEAAAAGMRRCLTCLFTARGQPCRGEEMTGDSLELEWRAQIRAMTREDRGQETYVFYRPEPVIGADGVAHYSST